jgi:biopolymer transport protein ExbD
MAMKTSGGDDVVADINVTPLVDVMLVLLVIFMLTSTTLQAVEPSRVLNVDLPAAASAVQKPSSSLSIVLDKQGKLFLDGQPLSPSGLDQAVRGRLAAEPGVTALVSADRAASHGDVVGLMDSVRRLGVRDIAINTKAQDIQ